MCFWPKIFPGHLNCFQNFFGGIRKGPPWMSLQWGKRDVLFADPFSCPWGIDRSRKCLRGSVTVTSSIALVWGHRGHPLSFASQARYDRRQNIFGDSQSGNTNTLYNSAQIIQDTGKLFLVAEMCKRVDQQAVEVQGCKQMWWSPPRCSSCIRWQLLCQAHQYAQSKWTWTEIRDK